MRATRNGSVQEFPDGITAIDTHYVRPQMDASHLILHDGRAAFVDTGTTHSVPYLLGALEEKGINRQQVDLVLLTHVHLDHAGGAGALMRELPDARAVIHPRGARHMIDPGKLIAGSISVYGEELYQQLYGEVVPIAADRVTVSDDGMKIDLAGRCLELIHTPGHAKHHYCIIDRYAKAVFSGDTFGISYREFDTGKGEFVFPTTTPIHFDPEAAHASIERILSHSPESVFLTHYSRVLDIPRLAADLHEWLDTFVQIANEAGNREDRFAAISSSMKQHLLERLFAHGYQGSESEASEILDPDIQLNTQGLIVWLDQQVQQ